jgi:uncharacterized protein YbjQ (UPF0145 family)
MPFWRKDTDRERQQKEEQAAAVAALESGQILPRAKRRIEDYLKSKQGTFSSDLSALELLITKEAQIEPISQVFGVSVLSISFLSMANLGNLYQYSQELYSFSDAVREARRNAFSRMQQEAQLLGASGVVGVKILSKKAAISDQTREYTVVGTAVRIPNHPPDAPAFTSTLSGSELWQLLKAGYRPVSVVSGQSCYFISPDWAENRMLLYSSGLLSGTMSNQELLETTSNFIAARETAMFRLQEELRECGADGVVGVEVDYEIDHFEYEGRTRYGSGYYSSNSTTRMALLISFNVIGTAVMSPPYGTKSALESPTLIQDLASGKGRGFGLNLEDL